jgi:aspartyl-tRNA(Asn)/glutamyl-tRNA(Gln) amidotransferase subunit C
MKIEEQQVINVAKLVRLEVGPDEVKRFADQLSQILTYVGKLNELDTSAVEPTSHVIPLSNVFREDKATPSLLVDEVMENAPDAEPPFFRVPKIIE